MLLHTEQLTKDYGRYRALDQLNLDVAAGEVVGLLGPNGSGKTTALRLLLGFLRPTTGRCSIAGHDCWSASVAARQNVAYLPGELRLYENMTGRQLIRFLCGLRSQSINGELPELARRFDIDLDRPMRNLSSGMKRKIALLQVLLVTTPLVIMDEPSNALDPTMRDELLEQVRRCKKRGQTVLFSSHVLSEVEEVCDRVAILSKGRLVHMQSLTDLRQGRLVRARCTGSVGALPNLEGLSVVEQTAERFAVEMTGPLPELLRWLADQPVTELHIEPLGLTSIYSRYHGGEA